jgi:hypothetical protein
MTTKKATPQKAPISVTRQGLRDSLLGHAPKPMRKEVSLFGQTIELQQPTLRAILDAQNITDNKERSIDMIIQYAYVPGTNDHIFEAGDKEMILQWPFTRELLDIQLAIAELTGVDVGEAEEVLKGSPLDAQS